MPFTLTLDLTETNGAPADPATTFMYVRPARLLLDDDPNGTMVYTETERTVAVTNGTLAATLASADQIDGNGWYRVHWTGHTADDVWIPAQPDGAEVSVRRWVLSPETPAPEVPALTARVVALEDAVAELTNRLNTEG